MIIIFANRLWWLLSRLYPPYILPSPGNVIMRLISRLKRAAARHLAVTAGESFVGLCWGIAGLTFGYLLARITWLEGSISVFCCIAGHSDRRFGTFDHHMVWVWLDFQDSVAAWLLFRFA